MGSSRRHTSSSTSSRSSDSSSRKSDKSSSRKTKESESWGTPATSVSEKSSSSSGSRRNNNNTKYPAQPQQQQQQQKPAPVSPPPAYYPQPQAPAPGEDLSPGTSLYPRSSVETYASTTGSGEDLARQDGGGGADDGGARWGSDDSHIPPLGEYRHEVVEPNVRASNPADFARLFPSMNRLCIRHDDLTPDGNMNLRVDTVVSGGPSRRRATVQLFHLRMYDLGKREFSLRRYCRDSGREVCNSKRKYTDPNGGGSANSSDHSLLPGGADGGRPGLPRSVSTAMAKLGSAARPANFRRVNSGGSLFGKGSGSSKDNKDGRRPGSSSSTGSSRDGDDEMLSEQFKRSLSFDSKKSGGGANHSAAKPVPTNTIKLEFSNYARVDVERRGGRGSKRYDFEWWGHRYSWRRATEKHLGSVAFHLVRDGNSASPVAHVVPEIRDPIQVLADEEAGGWVPPCYMWISDESVLDCMTDVADVIISTGLMALVDDCIKERWSAKKTSASSRASEGKRNGSSESVSRKVSSAAKNVFRRGTAPPPVDTGAAAAHTYNNNQYHYQQPNSPLRYAHPVAAY